MVIGRILKPHGVRGEIRVEVHTDLPERFSWLKTVVVGPDDLMTVTVENVRFHQGQVIMRLLGYDDRDRADTLRGRLLMVPIEESIPLEDDEYFLFQLIGLRVITSDNEELGNIAEVLETGANNVFVVHGPDGELLLPDIGEVVQKIDFDQRLVIVNLLPGLRGS